MSGEASGLQLWDIATQQPLGSELTTSDEKTDTPWPSAPTAARCTRAARTCRSSGTRSIHLGRPRRCAHGWEATTGHGRSGRRTYRTRRTGRCAADELTAPMERSTTRRHRRRVGHRARSSPSFAPYPYPYPYEFSSPDDTGPATSPWSRRLPARPAPVVVQQVNGDVRTPTVLEGRTVPRLGGWPLSRSGRPRERRLGRGQCGGGR